MKSNGAQTGTRIVASSATSRACARSSGNVCAVQATSSDERIAGGSRVSSMRPLRDRSYTDFARRCKARRAASSRAVRAASWPSYSRPGVRRDPVDVAGPRTRMTTDDRADLEAEAEATKGDPAADVRRWLLTSTSGALATISRTAGFEGWPFGSIVPYALDGAGRPLILIAQIAVHTQNAKADPRASLLVSQPDVAGDPQAGWRITVLGRLSPVPHVELEESAARYVERVPSAASYHQTHDFEYWRLSVDRVRSIGGFGKICWVDGAAATRDAGGGGLREAAAHVVAHMNDDHVENMREMCRGLYGFAPEQAAMTSVDRTGFFVRTQGPDRLVHFSFGREITGDDVRTAVIDVLKRARAAAH
jgi:heme iron utilization protein